MMTATEDPTIFVGKEKELIFSRVLNAPRALVWKAFTQPEHVIKWWGPNGFTHTFHEFNFAEGGVWRFMMHGPDGTDYPNRVIFTEITPMDRIAYDHDGDDGKDDVRFSVVTSFEDRGSQTFITHHMTAPSEVMMQQMQRFGAVEGAKQHLARLNAYLQSMQ
jgi:uncharacterized protein YndB with AHSA1/START domain